jgi:hypothetical protein
MTLNLRSGAGKTRVFIPVSPKYADLIGGYTYALHLINTTDAEINAGNIVVETAPASDDDPCVPGTWAPLQATPQCDAPPGTDLGAVTLDLSKYPVAANTHCSVSWPCPEQFIRISGVPAGLDAVLVVSDLKRTDFTFDWVAPPFDARPQPLQVAAPAGGAQAA